MCLFFPIVLMGPILDVGKQQHVVQMCSSFKTVILSCFAELDSNKNVVVLKTVCLAKITNLL